MPSLWAGAKLSTFPCSPYPKKTTRPTKVSGHSACRFLRATSVQWFGLGPWSTWKQRTYWPTGGHSGSCSVLNVILYRVIGIVVILIINHHHNSHHHQHKCKGNSTKSSAPGLPHPAQQQELAKLVTASKHTGQGLAGGYHFSLQNRCINEAPRLVGSKCMK